MDRISEQGQHSQWRFDSHRGRGELVRVEGEVPAQPQALHDLCSSDEGSRLAWPDGGQYILAGAQRLVFIWACVWACRWGLRRWRGPSAGGGSADRLPGPTSTKRRPFMLS